MNIKKVAPFNEEWPWPLMLSIRAVCFGKSQHKLHFNFFSMNFKNAKLSCGRKKSNYNSIEKCRLKRNRNEGKADKIKPQIFALLFCFQCFYISSYARNLFLTAHHFHFAWSALFFLILHLVCASFLLLELKYIGIVCADFIHLVLDQMRKRNPTLFMIFFSVCAKINLWCTVIVTEPKKEIKKCTNVYVCMFRKRVIKINFCVCNRVQHSVFAVFLHLSTPKFSAAME